jgi:hypothetical protein
MAFILKNENKFSLEALKVASNSYCREIIALLFLKITGIGHPQYVFA